MPSFYQQRFPRGGHVLASRTAVGVGLYVGLTVVYFLAAAPALLHGPTSANHFAHLADSWLHGHLAMLQAPPDYEQSNDFALFLGRWFVVFPPLPAVLLLPFVACSGSAEAVRDGCVFLWLAGLGPTLLFFALCRMGDAGLIRHGNGTNLAFALLFGLGTVYWFSAEQGTVWFAAHVVGVALACLYLWASVEARHPLLAGVALALAFAARTPLIFALPWFCFELARVTPRSAKTMGKSALLFVLPVAVVVVLMCLYNHARFGHAWEFGYRYLTIRWRARIARFGLFSYHYLPRNLAVLLTSLPRAPAPSSSGASWHLSAHGLALWFTTPIYVYLLRRPARRAIGTTNALLVTAALVAVPSFFYQSSGFVQFGYRYSNDFAPFLFAVLAATHRRFSRTFWMLGAFGVLVNAFGALTFGRPAWEHVYDFRAETVLPPEDDSP